MTSRFVPMNCMDIPPEALQEWNAKKLNYLTSDIKDLREWHMKYTRWFDEATIERMICNQHNILVVEDKLRQGLTLVEEEEKFFEALKKECKGYYKTPYQDLKVNMDDGTVKTVDNLGMKISIWNPQDPSYKEKVDEMIKAQKEWDELKEKEKEEAKEETTPNPTEEISMIK